MGWLDDEPSKRSWAEDDSFAFRNKGLFSRAELLSFPGVDLPIVVFSPFSPGKIRRWVLFGLMAVRLGILLRWIKGSSIYGGVSCRAKGPTKKSKEHCLCWNKVASWQNCDIFFFFLKNTLYTSYISYIVYIYCMDISISMKEPFSAFCSHDLQNLHPTSFFQNSQVNRRMALFKAPVGEATFAVGMPLGFLRDFFVFHLPFHGVTCIPYTFVSNPAVLAVFVFVAVAGHKTNYFGVSPRPTV